MLAHLLCVLALSTPSRPGAPSAIGAPGPIGETAGFASGFATITRDEIARDLALLASPSLEGRDTPSAGLERAAQAIEERLSDAALVPAPDAAPGAYLRPFQRRLAEPDKEGCALELEPNLDAGPAPRFELGQDFVPLKGFAGDAQGDLVFAGYGIRCKSEQYDELAGLALKGRIALVLHGEPRSARRFDGPELSPCASLWEKIDALAEAGAAGVLAVRRPATAPQSSTATKASGKHPSGGAAVSEPSVGLSFRWTWAEFQGVASDPRPRRELPAAEVTLEAASELLGEDVEALAARIDKSVRAVRASAGEPRRVHMKSATKETDVRVDNVVAMVRGGDPALAEEYVVVGAHYDHVGVDARGRIACGADDNASGVAALLEIAQALATAKPRRSVILAAFAGEEDGLLGSQAFCERPPIPKDRIVAMINLDMIGRGDADEVAAIGVVQNPGMEKILERAKKLEKCGVRKVVMRQGEELFQRSDHYSFHRIGVPVLFVFEGLPIERNKDYHTWRDTLDKLDLTKVLNTTRFVYNATWILANDDERLPPPRG